MKTCNKCHRELPEEQFSKSKATKDGYQYMCKECTAAVASEVAVADDVGPAAAAEDDDDDDWYGVVEVSPATSAAAPADVFAQRAAQIRGLIGERYPHIAAMREPLRDDQLRWIAERYAMEDVRRILSDMDDKRVYDPHSRSYRTKTFNAFMAFADCDRMVGRGGAGRRADSALRPSKRLYTYEEMCDEIPAGQTGGLHDGGGGWPQTVAETGGGVKR